MQRSRIEYQQFEAVDIRLGTIISVNDYPEARNPSYSFMIDLGESIGVKKSIAQLKRNYSKEDLLDRQVLCVVNFAPRQIGTQISEVLTLGLPDSDGNAVLVSPGALLENGVALY